MKNILVVDDEVEIRSLIGEYLESSFADTNIVLANDGLEAYASAINTKFDLIITDHRMPFCTGLDFITKIRTTKNLSDSSPIIMVSGFIPEIESEISKLDNLYYLNKPFKLDRLIKYCKMTLNIVK